MKSIFLTIFLLISSAAISDTKSVATKKAPLTYKEKNWEYLVERLAELKVDRKITEKTYSDPRIPPFKDVPFKLAPKESKTIYKGFLTDKNIRKAKAFHAKYRTAFITAEKTYGVDARVICAILLVETQFGENTGDHRIFYRLSRVSSIGEKENLEWNITRIKEEDKDAEKKKIRARAKYLEDTFTPEIVALFEISKRQRVDPLRIKGSIAGAFGLPQFLPSSYLRYAVDGNKDSIISLYDPWDAIFSVGNFLKCHGWTPDGSKKEHEKALWGYNKSEAYIETVLEVASQLPTIQTTKTNVSKD